MRATSLLVAGALLSGVSAADAARFDRLIVVGDSLLAGFGSGGLVAHGRVGQVDGAASLVARQAGVRLPIPAMEAPGAPPPLAIVDANRNGVLDPGEVRRRNGFGLRAKPFRQTHNLAVPGEDVTSVFDEIGADDIAKQLVGADTLNGRDVLKFLILGLPPTSSSVSQLSRAHDLSPTFILVWIGNNDVLGMATDTNPAHVTLAQAAFATQFRKLLNALADTGAEMAVANLPDVTGIAALRTSAGEVTTCLAADGTMATVAPDDLLSIDLPRSSLPTPACGKVLDASERAAVRATIVGFNQEIASAIADVQTNRGVGIAPVDVFTLFDQIRTSGADVDGNGTPDVTSSYLGGLFSLDGIHPTRTGHALIANAFITAIDQRFGETLGPVDVASIYSRDGLAHSRFRPSGEPPFGLIGDDDVDDIESYFSKIFDRVAQGAKNRGGSLVDRIKRIFDL
jgi:phospholipase/lecithinase/hemolysin